MSSATSPCSATASWKSSNSRITSSAFFASNSCFFRLSRPLVSRATLTVVALVSPPSSAICSVNPRYVYSYSFRSAKHFLSSSDSTQLIPPGPDGVSSNRRHRTCIPGHDNSHLARYGHHRSPKERLDQRSSIPERAHETPGRDHRTDDDIRGNRADDASRRDVRAPR